MGPPGEFRLTLGATYEGAGRTRFRVWAPDHRRVEVVVKTGQGLCQLPLEPEGRGYFSGLHPVEVGARYRYRLDGGEPLPDPCSRFQPEGPHGPSEVVDPTAFRWTDEGWRGLELKGQVLYELHPAAYTQEGTWRSLAEELPALKALGVTALELMPVHAFPGRFNWGYDGVSLFAPCAVYGTPDELRALVDRAHRLGLGVLLDVVYNHLGPDGNYLARFARQYFTDRYPNEWGEPLNFDGEGAHGVRDLVIQNACYWLAEFHLDGLRLDATQCLHDASTRPICEELTTRARAAVPGRRVLVISENEPQSLRMVQPPAEGGMGADAVWVDDFHHSVRVAATGNAEAYCQDYRGTAQELVSCALRNSLYQGQYYAWQKKRRGTPLRKARPEQAVFYLQNHDQLANTLRGERLHQLVGAPLTRALTVFWLALPQTPMLFMGQEFFASAPFLYFVDHKPELQALVDRGRKDFLAQFESAGCALRREGYEPPSGLAALERSRLDLSERERNAGALALHRELLRLRREDPVLRAQDPGALFGAVLSERALALRFEGPPGVGDRLLLLNLGADLALAPCPEPLLAAGPGRCWGLLLSSEETRFGGRGGTWPRGDGPVRVPGHSGLLLVEEEARP